MTRIALAYFVGALCIAAPAVAQQLTVTHSGSGVVFDDDFEDDTVGNDPVIGGGNIGSGWVTENSPLSAVGDDTSDPIFADDQFLGVRNDGLGAGVAVGQFGQLFTTGTLTADFTAFVPKDLGSGNLTHASLVTFQNSNGGTGFGDGADSWTHLANGLWLQNEAGLDIASAGIAEDDAALAYFDGNAWNIATSGGSALSFPTDAWVDVQMTYNLDAGSFGFTVDGQTADSVTGFTNTIGNAQGILFRQNAGQGSSTELFNSVYIGGEGGPPIPGDTNGDREVDLADFAVVQANYGPVDGGKEVGNFNGDSNVDLFDFKIWKANRTDGGVPAVGIPEPASLLLIAMGMGALSAGSRRRT